MSTSTSTGLQSALKSSLSTSDSSGNRPHKRGLKVKWIFQSSKSVDLSDTRSRKEDEFCGQNRSKTEIFRNTRIPKSGKLYKSWNSKPEKVNDTRNKFDKFNITRSSKTNEFEDTINSKGVNIRSQSFQYEASSLKTSLGDECFE